MIDARPAAPTQPAQPAQPGAPPEHHGRPTLAELARALEPTGDVGLRERKKRARREALIDATHRLVARDGLDAVTVEAICEAAGVSTRTFFNYFESKDDAVLGHAPWVLSTPATGTFVDGGPTGDLLTDLQELLADAMRHPPMGQERFLRTLELASHDPRLLARHIAWVEAHRTQMAELVTERLATERLATERLATADDRAPAVDPDVVASLALFLVHSTAMRWEASPGTDPRTHLAALVDGLRALVV
ncbi:TetR/AcrR family transcriptional regulator [Cellulomonas palmilytica]|uniref:TetR/AcrR family transcriptional regulator n=1 Tax=Cellulomonas palmilytica TaxID=2608402 RepID=UPI001F33F543|nr:TetR/AcrR family transcriptional regulator [Cellulomonas palmilytica]